MADNIDIVVQEIGNDITVAVTYGDPTTAATIQAALGYTPADDADLAGKQDNLVSGTNIKTLNSESLLGAGNIEIAAGVDFSTLTEEMPAPDSDMLFNIGGNMRKKALANVNGFYNLKWFGAVGDGVTDDTAAVQAAIDQCKLDDATLYIPDGDFLCSGLTIVAPFQITGNGYNSCFKTTSNLTFCTVTGNKFFANNFRLDGNKIGTNQRGFSLNTVQNFWFDRIDFEGLGREAINLDGIVTANALGGTISNSSFINCRTAVFVSNRYEYINLLDNTVNQCTYAGYDIAAGNFNIVGGSISKNNIALWIKGGTNSAHSLVSGVLINHNTSMILQDFVEGLSFVGCQIHQDATITINKSRTVVFEACNIGTVTFNMQGCKAVFSNTITINITMNKTHLGEVSEVLFVNNNEWAATPISNLESATENNSIVHKQTDRSGVVRRYITDRGDVGNNINIYDLSGATPTQGELDTISGGTAASKGLGYSFFIQNSVDSNIFHIISDGTNWKYKLYN